MIAPPIDVRLNPRQPANDAYGGQTMYDDLIESWNNMSATQRTERVRVCQLLGHHYQPLSDGTRVCSRCVTYEMEARR